MVVEGLWRKRKNKKKGCELPADSYRLPANPKFDRLAYANGSGVRLAPAAQMDDPDELARYQQKV